MFIDKITRACYTSGDLVLALQEITITMDIICTADSSGRAMSTPDSFTAKRFARTVNAKITKSEQYHSSKSGGGAKTISYIVTVGKFTTHAHGGLYGDVAAVSYDLNDGNDPIVIDLDTFENLFHEGDTL